MTRLSFLFRSTSPVSTPTIIQFTVEKWRWKTLKFQTSFSKICCIRALKKSSECRKQSLWSSFSSAGGSSDQQLRFRKHTRQTIQDMQPSISDKFSRQTSVPAFFYEQSTLLWNILLLLLHRNRSSTRSQTSAPGCRAAQCLSPKQWSMFSCFISWEVKLWRKPQILQYILELELHENVLWKYFSWLQISGVCPLINSSSGGEFHTKYRPVMMTNAENEKSL